MLEHKAQLGSGDSPAARAVKSVPRRPWRSAPSLIPSEARPTTTVEGKGAAQLTGLEQVVVDVGKAAVAMKQRLMERWNQPV